jgi:hypothetical protein
MKKILLFLTVFLAFVLNASAQSVPNGDFETWASFPYEIPQNYVQSSNPEAFYRCSAPFNCVKVADPFTGTYAVKLTTAIGNNDTCFGYVINGNPNGNPASWHGGIPYTQTPTGITGFYKSGIPAGDSAAVIVNFSKNGSQIGQYILTLYGTHSTYTPFTLTFNPALSVAPDSVMFGITSSDVFDGIAMSGSWVQVDNVSFTGVISQPTLLNGDFENWTTVPLDIPTGWYINNSEGKGFFKSTDAYSGSYALEVQTYLGDRNGTPRAQAGNISSGYYVCPSSPGPCYLYGGKPFSNNIDTLSFYYKYAPSSNDSALVDMSFKVGGNTIGFAGTTLGAAATYQYVEIPFNLGTTPDSVVVNILSSKWADTSTVYVGSDLKIDQLQFKSQPLGLKTYVDNNSTSVFPNPSSGIVYIQSDSKVAELRIMDILGKQVYSATVNNYRTIVDLSAQPKGIYFYELKNEKKIISGKLLIQ